MRLIKVFFLSFFLITITIYANVSLKKADLLFKNKQYLEAVEIYKQTMFMQEDKQILNRCIKGLGHSFFEMGMYEKAAFYYKKYLETEKDYKVMKNLLVIFKQNNESDNILALLNMFPETEEKYIEKIKILKSLDRKESLFESYVKLFSLTGKYNYYIEAYNINQSIYSKLNNNKDIVFITEYYMKKIKRSEIIPKIKDLSRVKQINIADYFSSKKNSVCILIYEHLNKDFDVTISRRLIELYFKYGNIDKLKKEVQRSIDILGEKRFLIEFYYTLSSLAMYDTIIEIIKNIPDYYRDPTIFYKLLDVYRNGMSYSRYFEELLFLNKQGSFPTGRINSICKNLFYSDTNWAIAFCETDLIKIVSSEVYSLALYYSKKNKKLKEVVTLLNRVQLKSVIDSIKDKKNIIKSIGVDIIIKNKLYSYIEYLDINTIRKIFDNSNDDMLTMESALLVIKDNPAISSKILSTLSNKLRLDTVLAKLKDDILKKNAKKDILFYENKNSILYSVTKNYINNISILKDYKRDYMKKLIRLVCQNLFLEKKYKEIKQHFESLNLEKDDLYWTVYSILINNPDNIILNTEDWFRLELYRISVSNSENSKEELLKDLYFNRRNH